MPGVLPARAQPPAKYTNSHRAEADEPEQRVLGGQGEVLTADELPA